MYEVELKVRADHETVRERLETIEAEFRRRVTQEDTYYDAPHRAFGETDEALRVRREATVETVRGTETGAGVGVGTGVEDGSDERGTSETERDDGGTSTETAVFTYKGPLVDDESKTRREAETVVGDAAAADEILVALDFAPAATVSKERWVYTGTDEAWTVVLDRVADVGAFVEVELEAERADIDAARERAREVLTDLGLDPDEQIRTSYLGLLLDGTGSEDD